MHKTAYNHCLRASIQKAFEQAVDMFVVKWHIVDTLAAGTNDVSAFTFSLANDVRHEFEDNAFSEIKESSIMLIDAVGGANTEKWVSESNYEFC